MLSVLEHGEVRGIASEKGRFWALREVADEVHAVAADPHVDPEGAQGDRLAAGHVEGPVLVLGDAQPRRVRAVAVVDVGPVVAEGREADHRVGVEDAQAVLGEAQGVQGQLPILGESSAYQT